MGTGVDQGAATRELRTSHSSPEKGLVTLPTDPREWSKSRMPTLNRERQESPPGEIKTPSYIGREGSKFTLPTWGGNSAGKLQKQRNSNKHTGKRKLETLVETDMRLAPETLSRPKQLQDESSSKLFLERTACDQAKRETVHRGAAEGLTGDGRCGGSCNQKAMTPKAGEQNQAHEKVQLP